MGPAVNLYFAAWLLTNSKRLSHLLEQYEFQVAPMLNPDGYVHTHTRVKVSHFLKVKQMF